MTYKLGVWVEGELYAIYPPEEYEVESQADFAAREVMRLGVRIKPKFGNKVTWVYYPAREVCRVDIEEVRKEK